MIQRVLLLILDSVGIGELLMPENIMMKAVILW